MTIPNTTQPKVEQIKKKEKLSDKEESDTSLLEQDSIQKIAEELGKISDAKQEPSKLL